MVPFRPISRIQNIVDELGLTITYAYDDLVFIEHNAFILQFEAENKNISLFFNDQSDKSEHQNILDKITSASTKHELIVRHKGFFSMEQKNKENLQISFFPLSDTNANDRNSN